MIKVKNIILISVLITLSGCNFNKDEIFLSCNGFSEIINVYGNNIEEKREPKLISVEIRRTNTNISDYFKDPIYEIKVDTVFFDKSLTFSDKGIILGQKRQDTNEMMIDQTIHLNRNTNHLIFKNTTFTPSKLKKPKIQYTSNFEGKCEKVKERI